jgi:hypothetical protein
MLGHGLQHPSHGWWKGAAIGALLAALLGLSSASAQTLSVGANVTSSPVRAGERVVYEAVVSNVGSGSTNNFTLSATVPPFTSVPISEATRGASCSSGTTPCTAGQELRWTTSVAAGRSQSFSFSALVSTGAPPAPGTALGTVVTAVGFGLSAFAEAVVASSSGLNLTLRDAPSVVAAGGSFTYTLTYGNAGSSSVSAQLQLPLPPGVSFVAASDGGTHSSGTVLWNLGSLPPGAAGRRSVTVQVAAGTASGALIGAGAQLRETSTQAELARAGVITTVSTTAPLEVAASASPDPVLPGQRTTYTVTVANRSSFNTNNFTLSATVPPFTSVAISEASTINAVDFGATTTTEAVVAASSGLNLTLRDAPSVVAAGGSFTYTLTYGNAGSSSVSAQLQLPLPPGVSFVAASDGGTHSSGTVLWNLGSLPPGAAGRRSVTVQVAAGTASARLPPARPAALAPRRALPDRNCAGPRRLRQDEATPSASQPWSAVPHHRRPAPSWRARSTRWTSAPPPRPRRWLLPAAV